MPTDPTSPDAGLAARVCKLLGWTFNRYEDECIWFMFPDEDVTCHVTWPDLSAACLRHVEAKGWWLWQAASCVDGTISVELSNDAGRVEANHPDLFRALCAAAVAACETEGEQA